MPDKIKIYKLNQEVLFGSSRLFKDVTKFDDRTSHMINNIDKNVGFKYLTLLIIEKALVII